MTSCCIVGRRGAGVELAGAELVLAELAGAGMVLAELVISNSWSLFYQTLTQRSAFLSTGIVWLIISFQLFLHAVPHGLP